MGVQIRKTELLGKIHWDRCPCCCHESMEPVMLFLEAQGVNPRGVKKRGVPLFTFTGRMDFCVTEPEEFLALVQAIPGVTLV